MEIDASLPEPAVDTLYDWGFGECIFTASSGEGNSGSEQFRLKGFSLFFVRYLIFKYAVWAAFRAYDPVGHQRLQQAFLPLISDSLAGMHAAAHSSQNLNPQITWWHARWNHLFCCWTAKTGTRRQMTRMREERKGARERVTEPNTTNTKRLVI